MERKPILLRNVRVHNLKGVNLELQPGQLVVFTGVSGSGKSSLAFDTIYVEGQRRYIESLSHQARRFLSDLPKPEADEISGIAPTIAIEQKTAGRTPRSTVGTMTAVYDFLRIIFARIGTPYCPVSGEPVAAQSREKIVATARAFTGKIIIAAPFARGKKSEFKEEFTELLSRGFMRVRVDGEVLDLSEEIKIDGKKAHDVDVIIDRLASGEDSRIQEAIYTALEMGKGLCLVNDEVFSQHAFSPKSGLSYGPLEPHDFSFNHPSGMCPTCHGLGITSDFDLNKIIDPEKSIAEDCCVIASSYNTVRYGNIFNHLARTFKFNVEKPWKSLPEKGKEAFLYGFETKWTRMHFTHPETGKRWYEYVSWKGVLHEAKERFKLAKSDAYRKKMGEWMTEGICGACKGARIKPYPAAAKLYGKTIYELTSMPLEELLSWLSKLRPTAIEKQIAGELVKEIKERLQFLINVGLGYLSLERTSPTLSGGEAQRVRLASQIGAGLIGAIYVLDEPSIGLHPIDHHKLIDTIIALRDQGNTVLVVEHDGDTMRAADLIVDVGPGAGVHGGEIITTGSIEEVMQNPRSITGGYLSGRLKIEPPKKVRKPSGYFELKNATHHNLKNVSVKIPLGVFVCVTGVSGSGKSSLITDTLYPKLEKAIHVDQSPIGRTPRSNAATYIKLFDDIRDLFANLNESKIRGFTPGHFSFNVKEGSCPYCGGLGEVKIDMDFMEDAWVKCPQCKGKRFEPDVLSVQFKGFSIHDILEMDVERAKELFEAMPSIRKKLDVLSKVGLDYLTLGQPSTTLSGGEAQRIKLAKELARPNHGESFYILDEPTTGLHFHDINRLIAILQALVDKGNTVLVIEHNMEFVACADWLIDLGPGAGINGGQIVGEGTPKEIAKLNTATGKALKGLPLYKEKAKYTTVATDIVIEGAQENNLKNVSVKIPRGKMTVFTGPSGSGKSSLAFDTLYAEGQRRYTETLPGYARANVKQLSKPIVEKVEGLSPAIALEQKTGGLNPRSTVGTITEVYDHLRILYAHMGTPFDPETGKEIKNISKESIVEDVMGYTPGEKIQVLTPLETREEFPELLDRLNRQGYLRIRLNGKVFALDEEIPYDKFKKNELFLVIDRLVVGEGIEKRLLEAISKAEETVVIAREAEDVSYTFSARAKMSPPAFSFNHDAGMCPECQGLGETYGANLENEKRLQRWTFVEIAENLFGDLATHEAIKTVERYFDKVGEDQNIFLNGGPEIKLKSGLYVRWIGLHPLFAAAARMGNQFLREALLPRMQTRPCNACRGARLNPFSRNVRLKGVTLPDLCAMSLTKAQEFIRSLKPPKFLIETHSQAEKYLDFLLSIGLQYLALNRSAPTLSGGELQRLRLARQLGSGLTSCLYVLDEPTIGLHPHNNELLNQALQKLKDLGNTLVLVEHDPMTVKKADYLVDFGPGAGVHGGQIVASGTIEEIMKNPKSLTGAYLSGRKTIPIPKKRRAGLGFISIENATLHNLQNVSVDIPLSAITCLTGVSGSGKSSLMTYLDKRSEFEKIIKLDQSPIGQTSRADVSTYTEIQPLIRAHYAAMPLAQTKGLLPRHFSPNHLRGMCKSCWGLGYKTIDLQFLPAVRVVCDTCHGHRLNSMSLEVRYKEKHFGEILQMTIAEAHIFFNAIPKIVKKLEKLIEVGLPYLKLGQELSVLSGGEAQRLRLSRELSKRESGKTLYLIDEPTVGLHSEDTLKLLRIFHALADRKNTLVIIEHNLDVIVNADHIIDLGPDAGSEGGRLIATGTPEEIARHKESRIARYIQAVLR